MTNFYKREELGPSGFSSVKTRSVSSSNVQKSTSIGHFPADEFKSSSSRKLPPLPRSTTLLKSETLTSSSQSRARPSIKEKYGLSNYNESKPGSRAGTPSSSSYYSPSAFTDLSKSSLSRRPSIKTIEDPPITQLTSSSSLSTSRRPSISRNYQPYQESTNRVPRPYSISYSPFDVPSVNSGLRSARASPSREIGTSYSSASSRRNSISKLPWPEPSPVRDLPPAAPKPKIKHYPLPPPRYEEGMIALSRRLRNRSASPAPNYSELELSNRPALVPAALGRPSPSREMIRMTMCGPPLRQYNYGRNI